MAKKRAIFEEVSNSYKETVEAKPKVGIIDQGANHGARGAIWWWLLSLFVLVMIMIVIGGLTRLTDSGLSITEWRPIAGALPPMSDQEWLIVFDKYKQIPEYELQNQGMSLSEFKFIYWWEWGHRQLGRFIGLVWAIGYFGFLVFRKIPPGWSGRLLFLGVLGGLQGAVGWWMVSSGLTGAMLDVASYRLATHLGLAFVILGFITWYMLHLDQSEHVLLQRRRMKEAKLNRLATGLMHLAFLQIILGALVAGIDAGRNYIDWPLMAGGFFPPDMFELSPWWRNFFENDGLVQFVHRMTGYVVFVFVLITWRISRKSGNSKVRFEFNKIFSISVLQMLLGIFTVMYSAQWQIAILHQIGAIILWVTIISTRFTSNYPPVQSVRNK